MLAEPFPITTFNGLAETAMRLLIILETHHGRSLDFETLRLMDFFSVLTADLGGPDSLHPPTPARGAAYNRRSAHITKALAFLIAAELVTKENGLYFAKNIDDGDPYRSQYLTGVQAASLWMKERSRSVGIRTFTAGMKRRALALAEESLAARPQRNADEMHRLLKSNYESDITRLKGLLDACEVFQCLLDVDYKSASNDNGTVIPPISYFEAIHSLAVEEIAWTQAQLLQLFRITPEMHRSTHPASR